MEEISVKNDEITTDVLAPDFEAVKAGDEAVPTEPEAIGEVVSSAEISPEETDEVPESPLVALVKLGLSEREANLVLKDREARANPTPVCDSLPRVAHSPRLNISYSELMEMKELFSELSDTEINRLYNKVTK